MRRSKWIRLVTLCLLFAENIVEGIDRLNNHLPYRSTDCWIAVVVIFIGIVANLIRAKVVEREMIKTTACLMWVDVLVILITHPHWYVVPRYLLEISMGILLWWLAGTIKLYTDIGGKRKRANK